MEADEREVLAERPAEWAETYPEIAGELARHDDEADTRTRDVWRPLGAEASALRDEQRALHVLLARRLDVLHTGAAAGTASCLRPRGSCSVRRPRQGTAAGCRMAANPATRG
jgi:hypothetical protein